MGNFRFEAKREKVSNSTKERADANEKESVLGGAGGSLAKCPEASKTGGEH